MIESMEAIVENTGALVYVIDLNTYEVIYANKKCIEEFGNVLNKTCFKVLQKGQKEPCSFCPAHKQKTIPSLLTFGKTFEWENINSINNHHYMFTDRIIKWKDGRKVKVQIGIDITNQKELEKQILKEKDDFINSFSPSYGKPAIKSRCRWILLFCKSRPTLSANFFQLFSLPMASNVFVFVL